MPDTGSHSVDKEENKSLISDEAPIHAYKRLLAYNHDWDYTYFIVTLCQQKALYHICKFVGRLSDGYIFMHFPIVVDMAISFQ